MTVGIIGAGRIGQTVAAHLSGFGCKVLYWNRTPKDTIAAEYRPLDDLLKECDIISLHLTANDETSHFMDAEKFAKMKPGSVLINTARGALVDEEALAQALRGGKLKYACLDVTDPEPPAADSSLRGIPNCIMTPHLAGLANNGKLKIGAHVADEIGRFLTGGALVSEITQAMLATIA